MGYSIVAIITSENTNLRYFLIELSGRRISIKVIADIIINKLQLLNTSDKIERFGEKLTFVESILDVLK